MQRFITEKLIKWKKSTDRKPLILRGARQVGKTYIVSEFGEENYKNMAYFNFDSDDELKNVFKYTKDPERLLDQLRIISGKEITKENTLIFFDEIQECTNALNSLKYFNEFANEYHIIAAGSLLGIKLGKTSFPVGKVEYLDLRPLSFSEFLIANSYENYLEAIKDIKNIEYTYTIHEKLIEQLKLYYVIGGMPKVLEKWITTKNIESVYKEQQNIIDSYIDDFGKYNSTAETIRISQLYNNIPSQLAKENKKFLYQTIKQGARAREYEIALNWIIDANLAYKAYNLSKPEIPLKAYQDISAFKIYLNDVGLLTKHSNIDGSFIKKEEFHNEFKGSLTENFVINSLINNIDTNINYYTFKQYEIDFLIQYKNDIIPIEVKSSNNINSKSLNKYKELYEPRFKIKLSTNRFDINENTINIPLYMVDYIDSILDKYLE